MRALIVVVVVWLCATGLGRTLIDRLLRRRVTEEPLLRPQESFVFASAAGFGIIAYAALAAGLVGLFTPAALGAIVAAAGLVGVPGLRSTWRDFQEWEKRRAERAGAPWSYCRMGIIACWCLLGFVTLVAIVACLQPPGAHAWDSLAYHLADPKVYLQQHRILILPTDHHSNFPFTMEMLFSIGLAFDGYAAANLFHLAMFVLLILAVVSACARYLSYGTGLIAAIIVATTPVVLWEATVAYTDLGLSLYVFIAWYAVEIAMRDIVRTRVQPQLDSVPSSFSRLLLLGGILMGFALGMKYLALLPLTFLILISMLRRIPARSIAFFVLTAVAVASPWYLKNIVWMRNPVYPFAYSAFPQSRYWSESRARPYSEEQQSFGSEHSFSHPISALRNLASSPWNLLANPQIYANKADFTFTSLIGGLYAGFILSLAFVRSKPPFLWDAAIMLGLLFASWFFVSQHVRYLVPALPFAAAIAAYAANHWLELGFGSRSANVTARSSNIVNRVPGFLALGAIVGHVIILAWGTVTLPVSGRADPDSPMFTSLSIPEVFTDLLNPSERDRHMRRLYSYAAAEWLNKEAPLKGGVVLYEDVHGFYHDRPYLWGNGEHSSYIPYEQFSSAQELTSWMRSHGYVYALFNLNFAPANPGMFLPDDTDVIAATLRNWYDGKGLGWRSLVGQAIQSGDWAVRYTHHGVAVLEIGAQKP